MSSASAFRAPNELSRGAMAQAVALNNMTDPSLPLRLSRGVIESLCCPVCRAELNLDGAQMSCVSSDCGATFPVIDGVPVLLNEDASVFSIHECSARSHATPKMPEAKVKTTLRRVLPRISKNIGAQENYEEFSHLLLAQSAAPRVLVVGGSVLGNGMEPLAANRSLELVETDVSLGPRTMLVCDAHDIPLRDETFDGVIVQAVLEHVVDPYRCVREIHRVLKRQGLVYSETPFMQQVHMGRYDFTRFTHLGHRRLFREFEEIQSGAVCGPGMALAWAYQYFLLSFAASGISRALLMAFARLTSFYLKYFDSYLIDKPGSFDAASGYYFMGRKASKALSDRELIKLYKGAI